MVGWSQMEKRDGSGVWLFRGTFKGENLFLPFAQQESGNRRGRIAQRGRSLVIPRVLVRMRTGKAQLSGRRLVRGAGHCKLVCGGLSHP